MYATVALTTDNSTTIEHKDKDISILRSLGKTDLGFTKVQQQSQN